ncbi:hypothetical protein V1511DRAFT_495003 [Dipodascopsis uninucleata]
MENLQLLKYAAVEMFLYAVSRENGEVIYKWNGRGYNYYYMHAMHYYIFLKIIADLLYALGFQSKMASLSTYMSIILIPTYNITVFTFNKATYPILDPERCCQL